MAILPIVEVPDPRLRQISSPVEKVDGEVRKLIADMFETMYAAPGIGLAAIQVGVPKRVLVMDLQEPADPEDENSPPVKEPRVFINPEILTHSEDEVPYTEGCLSVPDQYADVERPKTTHARWLDEHGVQHEEALDEPGGVDGGRRRGTPRDRGVGGSEPRQPTSRDPGQQAAEPAPTAGAGPSSGRAGCVAGSSRSGRATVRCGRARWSARTGRRAARRPTSGW